MKCTGADLFLLLINRAAASSTLPPFNSRNHHSKAAIQIPSLACHNELGEGVFLRRAPIRQFHTHHDLIIRRENQTILTLLNRHPLDQALAVDVWVQPASRGLNTCNSSIQVKSLVLHVANLYPRSRQVAAMRASPSVSLRCWRNWMAIS